MAVQSLSIEDLKRKRLSSVQRCKEECKEKYEIYTVYNICLGLFKRKSLRLFSF